MPAPPSLSSLATLSRLDIHPSPPTPSIVPPTAPLPATISRIRTHEAQMQSLMSERSDRAQSQSLPAPCLIRRGDDGGSHSQHKHSDSRSYSHSQSPARAHDGTSPPYSSRPRSHSQSSGRARSSSTSLSPTGSIRSSHQSPLNRSPTHRPLSPDLPNRDALYLFSNFSSYMRSPDEGSEGVRPEDFRDTIRLLDHARALASNAHSNVHILHLKYRFQGQANHFRSPYFSGDYQLPLNYRDSVGRLRNPVPQPFSVLHDPVVKIDYLENGVFEPLPAQAVFSHIAKMCQPPPRIIVISYVHSKVIENHLSSLSTWALESSPPSYVFSPLETRLRETQLLHIALHHAIPMSMYAWPAQRVHSPSGLGTGAAPMSGTRTGPTSPTGTSMRLGVGMENLLSPRNRRRFLPRPQHRQHSLEGDHVAEHEETDDDSPILITRRLSGVESPTDIVDRYYARNQSDKAMKQYSADPIASLTVISSSPPPLQPPPQPNLQPHTRALDRKTSQSSLKSPSVAATTAPASASVPRPVDRIPLWHLAPGVGVLYGSTSASIGVKLSDFSAINLVGEGGKVDYDHDQASKGTARCRVEIQHHQRPTLGTGSASALGQARTQEGGEGSQISPMPITEQLSDLVDPLILLEQPISRPSSTTPAAISIPGNTDNQVKARSHARAQAQAHIQPVGGGGGAHLSHLSPPQRQVAPLLRTGIGLSSQSRPTPQSWPAPVSRVPGWRKGRKEMMDDTMEELSLGISAYRLEVGNVARRVEELTLGEERAQQEDITKNGQNQAEAKERSVQDQTDSDLIDLLIEAC